MFRHTALSAFCLIAVSALPFAALAQDSDNPDMGAARLDVRLAQLEEQMRRMEGTLEQLSYENKQLKAQLDKSNADTQYRLQALETKTNAGPAAAVQQTPASPVGNPPAQAQDNEMQQVQPEVDTSGGDNANTAPPPSEQFASPSEHYKYAFRLMNQAKYADAGASFTAFTRQYPHDALIGNAFYWLGETYYVRRDYMQAADNFRQGYEAMPQGPKAGDNLLKLAMSLEALKKDKEACIVLRQVSSRYDNSANSLKSRADQEINRVGCN